ncbi:unnamed protein product [Prorocentrum cordatum]|uniref:Uncharacterized protein n=1 Tax=Prorocentrum cordatum TaxID=2364126 RepID=A0ABN9WUS1_9DINO|nr:unnamed protein product [Polarella glacialis]
MGSERMGRRIAPHRRRRRGRNRAPHRAASPQHRQRGAIFRPFLLGPHLGGWNYFGVALAHVRASPGQSSLAGSGSCRILQDLALWLTTFTLTPASHGSTWAAPDPPLWPHPPSSHRPARGAPSGCRRGLRAGGPGGGQRRHARARNGARRRPSPYTRVHWRSGDAHASEAPGRHQDVLTGVALARHICPLRGAGQSAPAEKLTPMVLKKSFFTRGRLACGDVPKFWCVRVAHPISWLEQTG